MKKKRRSKTKCFFTSMLVTLLLCMLITGFIVVDINTRKTGFAGHTLDPATPQSDNDPKLFNLPISLNPELVQNTKKTLSEAYIIVPAPIRLINQGIKAIEEKTPDITDFIKSKF